MNLSHTPCSGVVVQLYYTISCDGVLICDNPPCCCMIPQEGEEFLAREAKRSKTDEEAAEGEKDSEVAAEA